jgi:hypothetical protein
MAATAPPLPDGVIGRWDWLARFSRKQKGEPFSSPLGPTG